jgi:hypothetical protein
MNEQNDTHRPVIHRRRTIESEPHDGARIHATPFNPYQRSEPTV